MGRDDNVKSDSADFYRFFDATLHAEFLYDCVRKTIIVVSVTSDMNGA